MASRRAVLALPALAVALSACQPSTPDGGGRREPATPGPSLPAFPVTVSANARHLVDQSGRPFLYTADTCWTLLSRISVDDARRLLDVRRAQGFNAVQTVLTPFTITDSGPRGTPFEGADLTRPRPGYWAGVDEIMDYAGRLGMLLYTVPLWMAGNGGWTCDTGECVPAPSVPAMQAYMAWVGDRYRDRSNLLWVIGGDDEIDRNREVKQAGAVALRAAAPRQLMTYHPRWAEYGFSTEPWHSFNSFQKNDITPPFNYEQIRQAYDLVPAKPVLHAEPPYEPQTAMQDGDVTTPRLNRTFGWWAALSGAMGVVYGGPPGSWKAGQDAPPDWRVIEREQAVHIGNIRRVLAPLPWPSLEPDWNGTVITSGRGTYGGDDYATAARAADGSLVVAYAPSGRTFTVDLSTLRRTGTARWIDPVSGDQHGRARPVGTTGTAVLSTPGTNAGGDADWVLIIDAAGDG